MSPNMPSYDAVVVGSGAAGGWAAKELAEAGLHVLVLEAGPLLDEAIDFPSRPMPILGIAGRVKAAIRGQAIQASSPAFMRRTQHLYVNDRRNPYASVGPNPFLWIRGRQVGGRLHAWMRAAVRMSDVELSRGGSDAEGAWPITFADLAPHYEKVESTLGVSGESRGCPRVPDGRFVAPAPLSPMEARFAELVTERVPNAYVTPARTVRRDPHAIPLPLRMALATKRVDLRPSSVVTEVVLNEPRTRAVGVRYVDAGGGEPRVAHAGLVFLCASTIESVRLLLASGIGSRSSAIGRYLCDHLMMGLEGAVSGDLVNLPPLREPLLDPYDFRGSSLYIPYLDHVSEPGGTPPAYGIQCTVGRNNAMGSLLAFGEMEPRFENRIELDPRQRDRWRMPVARIWCRRSDRDGASARRMGEILAEIASAGGIDPSRGARTDSLMFRLLRSRVMDETGCFWPGLAIHETGGARMGSDPETSVVDHENRCWDVSNVLVTDGACFPSSGFQNHTLTIMALTVRACAGVVKRGIAS